nr:MAG TPA: hypothetical protein [Caudoviricetes sp.]
MSKAIFSSTSNVQFGIKSNYGRTDFDFNASVDELSQFCQKKILCHNQLS